MNREIKFRAWDKEDKVMRQVGNINFFDEMVRLDEKPDGSGVVRRLSEVELIEYTGLNDKNGVDIYEGDIVRLIKINWPSDEQEFVSCKVYFNKGSFTIDHTFAIDGGIWNDMCEVIGSIYENPELIK